MGKLWDIIAGIGVLAGSVLGTAEATDTLKIYNQQFNPVFQEGLVTLQHREGALDVNDVNASTDSYDRSKEALLSNLPSESMEIYSDANNIRLDKDARPLDSNTPFNLKLVYNNSNLTESKSNNLKFEFGTESFANKEITFQSDRLPYGDVADVREAIAQNGGNIPLNNLEAGSYNVNTPYGSGTLEIGTRLLSDLNDDKIVNMRDYAEMVADFGKEQGQYVGDITGVNGIPDGYVDIKDVQRLSSDWLREVE
mgnify:CR=1 FL=1|jgi:hypothetical protein